MTNNALNQLASFLGVDPIALGKELRPEKREESGMSASIYWKPSTNDGINIDVGGSPSSFIDNIKKVFGTFPLTLDEDDLARLETLASLFDAEDECQPYEELIQAVKKAGTIEVWAVY